MASDKQRSLIDQFIILGKSAKGNAAVALIKQVLETPGLYVFGELLDLPSIKELEGGPEDKYYKLLSLFAYGNYSDYKANKEHLPELTATQIKKLKHLTIVSLATKEKCIPYDKLLKELDVENLRELEDLIIEVIYADIIHGKLDQRRSVLEIDYGIGRDVKPANLDEIEAVLSQWCQTSETVLSSIEGQVNRANDSKEKQNEAKKQMELEIANVKKSLKSTTNADIDEAMVTDSREASVQAEKPSKKGSKSKGLRGSSKFWGKQS